MSEEGPPTGGNMFTDRREELAASDSEIERVLFELESNIPRAQKSLDGELVDGRYRVLRELGRGGFGRVYEVRHLHLGRKFAMKILHPSIATDPDFVTRFQKEAKATSLIGHDNIVFVTDFGECDQHGLFLVMEYLDGERLTDILMRKKKVSLRRALDCLVAVGSALSAVHELGIVHCDLKPANIMYAKRPGNRRIWKVLDFGTSSMVTRSVESESIFGTPRYMAPEQAVGLDVDPRSDVFTLGVVMYEMLSGEVPWKANGWLDAQPAARAKQPPTPLHELVPEINKATSDVVMKAIAVAPDDRWEDVETFVAHFRYAADVTFIPVSDSLDMVSEETSFKPSKSAPVVSQVLREASLVIEDPQTQNDHHWKMVFSTAERLRREYRRNIIAGGLFVMGDHAPPERDEVASIIVSYAPNDASIVINGRVVSHNPGPPRGFGVALDADAQTKLEAFLDRNGIRRTIGNKSMVKLENEPPASKWTPGQAFVLAMAVNETSMAELRARANGLPFDVEEAVFSLSDMNIVSIQDLAEPYRPNFIELTKTNRPALLQFNQADVERARELAYQFAGRGNFLAAEEVLVRAAAVSNNPAPFLSAIRKFKEDFSGVKASRRAMSPSDSILANAARSEETRVRLQQLLGSDALDD